MTDPLDEGSTALDALRIGQVVAVRGRTVFVQVDGNKHSSFVQFLGSVVPGVAVGSFVRIARGFTTLIGQVDGEDISDNRDPALIDQDLQGRQLKRVLTVSLIGRISDEGEFISGLADLPMISNPAFLLSSSELQAVNRTAGRDEPTIPIGHLLQGAETPVLLGVDAIMASHIGIFGNTGSGKSNTLGALLSTVISKYETSADFRENARFIMFDFNGEYLNRAEPDTRTPISADETLKREFNLGASDDPHSSRLVLPPRVLEDVEFWTVVLEATQKTQSPLLRRALENGRWIRAIATAEELQTAVLEILEEITEEPSSSVDANTTIALIDSLQITFADLVDYSAFEEAISFFRDVVAFNATLHTFYLLEGDTNGQAVTYSTRPRFRERLTEIVNGMVLPAEALSPTRQVQLRIALQYHREIARGYANREYLGPLIKRLETRLPDVDAILEFDDATAFDHVLTVICVASLSAEMQRMVTVLVTNWVYQLHRDMDSSRPYLAFVVDEAHNALSPIANAESDQWRDYRLGVFESVAKEGRKHGVFLHLASQRPSDVSATIVSQLHNYFVHRLVNTQDIAAIGKLVPYLDQVSFEQLPILATGICIVSGMAIERPLTVRVTPAPPQLRPISETPRPSDRW